MKVQPSPSVLRESDALWDILGGIIMKIPLDQPATQIREIKRAFLEQNKGQINRQD